MSIKRVIIVNLIALILLICNTKLIGYYYEMDRRSIGMIVPILGLLTYFVIPYRKITIQVLIVLNILTFTMTRMIQVAFDEKIEVLLKIITFIIILSLSINQYIILVKLTEFHKKLRQPITVLAIIYIMINISYSYVKNEQPDILVMLYYQKDKYYIIESLFIILMTIAIVSYIVKEDEEDYRVIQHEIPLNTISADVPYLQTTQTLFEKDNTLYYICYIVSLIIYFLNKVLDNNISNIKSIDNIYIILIPVIIVIYIGLQVLKDINIVDTNFILIIINISILIINIINIYISNDIIHYINYTLVLILDVEITIMFVTKNYITLILMTNILVIITNYIMIKLLDTFVINHWLIVIKIIIMFLFTIFFTSQNMKLNYNPKIDLILI